MRYWVWWLFGVSLALRLISLGASLLWYDEAYTAYMIGLPFVKMLAANAADVHPPLWYMIDWTVTQLLGRSEFAIRLPAAFFGAGGVVVLYELVNKLIGEPEARWSSGLMAIMPAQLYYSQEARMYSLLTLLVLLGAYAVATRHWRMLGLCAALIMFTQNLGAVYVLILAMWGLWVGRLRALKPLAVGALAYAPQAVISVNQLLHVNSGYWIPAPANLGGALYYIFFTTLFVRLPDFLQAAGMIASFAITGISVYSLRVDSRRLLPLTALAFAPSIILYSVSSIWKPIMIERALLPSGAALVGLWGIAITRLPSWAKKPLAAIGLPILVIGIVTYYTDPNEQRATSYPISDIVRENWQAGDVVYHLEMDSLIIQAYYLPERPHYLLPENGSLTQSLSNTTKTFAGIIELEKPFGDLKAMGYKRVWLMGGWSILSSQVELDSQARLLVSHQLLQQWSISREKLYEITVYLLRL